ncbi:response regulator [Desulfovibrio sp. OttesenSCG-928-G15]|nr:response regulator [Desulfovibrio sp. OttesenSCG-928-G15]
MIVARGAQRPFKANFAALALFQVKRPEDIDLGKLRSLAAYFPLQREWKGKGELMTFPLAGQILYCEVLRYPLDGADGGECCIIRDITHIVGLRGEIRKRSRLMRMVIDHLPSYISMKDEHCRLVFYNIAYSQLFDCGPEALIGKREYPGWSEGTMRQALRTDVLALGSDSTVVYDLEIPVGQTKRIHSIAKRRISGPDNETFIVTVGTDITERVELRRQLEVLKTKAEAANIAKTQFLARMSHEIRTPMNAIIGTSYLALTSSPKGKLKQYLETIQRSARNLLGIINDILDISKVEAGEMRLSIIPFNLATVIADVEEQITVLVHDKPVVFVSDYEPLSHYLLGDSLRLGQVLLNLCNNAVKFTDAGSITLRVTNQEEKGDTVTLLFEVEDTGIGIAPEDQERLFDSFSQLDDGPDRRYGGTGLGLAISQQFVNLMGSRVAVESAVGKGTRFYFTLVLPMAGALPDPALQEDGVRKHDPFYIPGEQSGRSDKTRSAAVGLEAGKTQSQAGSKGIPAEDWPPHFPGATVLVIEDNEVNREIIVEILEQMEITVDTAENGQTGLEAVQTRKYDLVFMDLQMPVMDGLTATRAIRSLESKGVAGLPIVALTANALPEDQARCLQAGMDAFLDKPIDVNALVSRLKHWLGEFQKR